MIYRAAHINIINRFGEEAEAKITAAQNVVNSSAFRYYDVETRSYVPMEAPEESEGAQGDPDKTDVA